MFCAYTRSRNKGSVYRTIGPLVFQLIDNFASADSGIRTCMAEVYSYPGAPDICIN